ncbi:MAG: hypothetical protein NTV51_20570 [Verrucomicrobia bacterium]|nr:hypothetical protein [Verrucomicrobiota bacterium]
MEDDDGGLNMEALLEVVLQILGEFLLELFVQSLAELGARAVAPKLGPVLNTERWLPALGYTLLGGLSGAGTLHFWPQSLIHAPALRVLSLIVVPLLAGATMSALGAWRKSRGQFLIRLDQFGYGWLFAFSFSLVRFIWAG